MLKFIKLKYGSPTGIIVALYSMCILCIIVKIAFYSVFLWCTSVHVNVVNIATNSTSEALMSCSNNWQEISLRTGAKQNQCLLHLRGLHMVVFWCSFLLRKNKTKPWGSNSASASMKTLVVGRDSCLEHMHGNFRTTFPQSRNRA